MDESESEDPSSDGERGEGGAGDPDLGSFARLLLEKGAVDDDAPAPSPATAARIASATPTRTSRAAAPLTDRELEIARMVAVGRTNAEIGDALFLSPGTVKNHVATIQRKLGARNRVGIAVWAWDCGCAVPAVPDDGVRQPE